MAPQFGLDATSKAYLTDEFNNILAAQQAGLTTLSNILEAIRALDFAGKTGEINIIGEVDGIPAEISGAYVIT